jgi:hypothetical protein
MRKHAFVAAYALACGLSGLSCDAYGENAPDDVSPPIEAGSDAPTAIGDAEAGADANVPAPVEVAVAQPRAMAASVSALVWLEGDEVRALRGSATAVALMTSMTGGPASGFVAIAGELAFMTQSSAVRRCNVASPCGDNASAPMYDFSDLGPLAVSDGEIYAAERGG